MKRIIILFITALCMNAAAWAQTFTEHLQQKQGQATVTVTQSKEIDKLVNEADVSAKAPAAKQQPKTPATQHNQDHQGTQTHADRPHNTTPTQPQHPRTEAENKAKTDTHKHENPSTEKDDNDIETTTADTRKKIMRNSYKVNGYRVQVFAGGNSRENKVKAQNIGNQLKAVFPDIPVYVHFYSPRWICRMGNFRTYQEAHSVLSQVQKLGYKQACIVSGKITVAY